MKEIIGTLAIMLFCIIALAQERSSDNIVLARNNYHIPKPASQQQPPVAPGNFSSFTSPVSVQVLAGTQGVGADFKYGFLPKLSGRLGFGIIPVNADRAFKFSGFAADGLFSGRFSNVHLLADYAPFATSNFRFVGGASYLIQGNAKAIIVPSNGYEIGNRSFTREELGAVYADVKWKGVAPYVGVALLRNFPKTLFNVNLDVGTYYISSPSTSFTGTQLLAENDANAQQFNKNMQGYRWLPVVQVNFNFRIK